MSFFEKLDDRDKAIITILSDDPDASQEYMAERIGISQPSVAVRLRKLRSLGIISKLVGVNPAKMGVYLAKVDITTRNPLGLLESFKDCPYFVNGFLVSGRSNVCMLFLSENIETIETIVDAHIRPNSDVQSVEFNIIISSAKEFIVPMKMSFKATENPPCGSKTRCRDCQYFQKNKCLGCPVIQQYKGKLWQQKQKP
ncbi:MAG: Lrp/AsnC family transcriptional regulator [Candidatus Jordarchaeales archaeon]|nr:Lrp/AsnC family transcriptional regulator [Candidatus Jordarchaeia archaeon]